jgi:hypothetical protein
MGKVFELYEMTEISHDDDKKVMNRLLTLGDDGMNYQETLKGMYGSDDPFLMDNLTQTLTRANLIPWMIILLDKEYPVSGHLMKVRKNLDDFKLAGYTLEQSHIGNDPPHPISILIFMKKEDILEYSKSSALMLKFWNELENLSEDKRWVLFSDPLKESLLEELQ